MPDFGLGPDFSFHRFIVRPLLSRDLRATVATWSRQRFLQTPRPSKMLICNQKKKKKNRNLFVSKIEAKTISFFFFFSPLIFFFENIPQLAGY